MSIWRSLVRMLSPATGSAPYREFYRNFVAAADGELARNGLDESVFARLTPDERVAAERVLLARLGNEDSRIAIGLGLLRSTKALAGLRRAMDRQGSGPFASSAYALAVWRIAEEPQAIDAAVAIARNPTGHDAPRVDAVVALAQMPAEPARRALLEILESEPEYLLRYHAFKGLLILHGYPWMEADDHAGALAREIGAALADPRARRIVAARLEQLTAGRTLAVAP